MTTRRTTTRRPFTRALSLGAATLGAAAALAIPAASASAAPQDRVPGTDCTTAQVERAVAATSPEVARYLDNPRVRGEFERIVVLPEPQRTAEVNRLLERNPRIAGLVRQYRPLVDQRVALVFSTCNRY
ncbi:hemophore-related protein [uncultured Williamsia sp.]|uniref:hemophore-related protein n=1 Tax=uncultured Williamsia sp. TaxID=259311 RepID=UPI0026338D6F|nr:hemophore-related protein [uncultured Williamsia sp.]